MKNKNYAKKFSLTAAIATIGMAPVAQAAAGSFLTLTDLMALDVDVIAEADVTVGANGVTYVDLDGAGNEDDGVYKVTADTTWAAGSNYILTRPVFVDAGVTLTIEAGVTVYSTFTNRETPGNQSDDEFGSVVVTRGGKLEANGTAAAPIIFTSIRELEAARSTDMDGDGITTNPTRFDRGLWGGVVLLGNAKTYNYSAAGEANLIGENEIEGFAPAFSPDGDSDGRTDIIEYGGSDDTDNSGTMRYVSIRHGGYEFAANQEVNGLTLGGVGSGTTLEYIEVFSNSDDGIEFFGGTVNLKNALVAFCKDDGLDIDEGYTGNLQFVAVFQNSTGDDSSGTSVQDSDHGGEWDGNVGGNADDVQSAPIIANLTFIGDNEGDRAFKIDDFFAGRIYNAAATGFPDLIEVTSDSVNGDTVVFENVTTDVPNALPGDAILAITEGAVAAGFTTVADVMLSKVDIANASFDPRPATGSPLLTGAKTDVAAIDAFFANTDYQGAFSAEENWAAGWTRVDALGHFDFGDLANLGPDDVDLINSSLVTFDAVQGVHVIDGSQTMDASKTYLLTDKLFVTGGNTLTIPAGTKIYNTFNDLGTPARADDKFGSIVVTRGAKIDAQGTADAPIIMTAVAELEAARGTDIDADGEVSAAPTRFDRGLWGGLVLLGNASVYNYAAAGAANRIGENEIEGFAPAFAPDADSDGRTDIIEYGGSDDADNSGTMRYVSIRHGGYEFEANQEINGLTLGGVGSGTTLEFIEVMSNSDDGIEFFGGTVNMTNALVAFCKDDGFDIDEGYTGKLQFIAVLQNPTGSDRNGDDVRDSDHGGEWDGNVGGNADDVQSAPIIANLTFIGDNEGDRAFKIDDFFAGRIYNGAATGFPDLIEVTSDSVNGDTAIFENVTTDIPNTLPGDPILAITEGAVAAGFTTVADVMLTRVDIANASFDLRPAPGSPLLTGATTDVAAIDAFFVNTDYQGAFTADENWAAGWTGVSALGLFDPVVLADEFQVISSSFENGMMIATFGTVPGAAYKVTQSVTLQGAFSDTIGAAFVATDAATTIEVPVPTDADRYFFRLEAGLSAE
ncbi:MAG: hypothetical protein ACJA1W_000275 [Akkermansiaceae bacterium]|jgi:hypothetical protein